MAYIMHQPAPPPVVFEQPPPPVVFEQPPPPVIFEQPPPPVIFEQPPPPVIFEQPPPPVIFEQPPPPVIIEQPPPPVIVQPAPQPMVIEQPPPPVIVQPAPAVIQHAGPVVMRPAIKSLPVSTKCSVCQRDIVTITRPINGMFTWVIAGALFWLCLCFIPFVLRSCKDIEHTCPNCYNVIYVYKRI